MVENMEVSGALRIKEEERIKKADSTELYPLRTQ
jgi:hypothetical protein